MPSDGAFFSTHMVYNGANHKITGYLHCIIFLMRMLTAVIMVLRLFSYEEGISRVLQFG